MNYTTNYKLPQWVETDRIQMEDFNEAMENIDKNAQEITLMSYTVESAAEEVSLDLSQFDLSRFETVKLKLRGAIKGVAGKHYLYFNDITTGENFDNYTGEQAGYLIMNIGVSTDYTDMSAVINLEHLPHSMAVQSNLLLLNVGDEASTFYYTDKCAGTLNFVLAEIKKLTFSFLSSFQPGFRFRVVGVPT